jgi:hypothetical protein
MGVAHPYCSADGLFARPFIAFDHKMVKRLNFRNPLGLQRSIHMLSSLACRNSFTISA